MTNLDFVYHFIFSEFNNNMNKLFAEVFTNYYVTNAVYFKAGTLLMEKMKIWEMKHNQNFNRGIINYKGVEEYNFKSLYTDLLHFMKTYKIDKPVFVILNSQLDLLEEFKNDYLKLVK